MCYTIKQLKYREYKYTLRYGNLTNSERIKLQEEWIEYDLTHPEDVLDSYHINGFQHPKLVTAVDQGGLKATRFQWGLIPHWVKDREQAEQIMNKTLNARGETIFEKPAFRDSANSKRCLILVDGFYEYYHFKGKTYPFYIEPVNKEFFVFGGLWSEWIDKSTGEIVQTAAIVTTEANVLMQKIHNKPNSSIGPRMPLILDEDELEIWLKSRDKSELQGIINPLEDGKIKAFTVGKLHGKDAVGDGPEAIEEVVYPELSEPGELF